ncbi:hypothetical protein PoB_003028000 [Plakobranchus ocellatus]|uniref:Uncharacterized protein n=1 Tax=Plakobranchus ocellatus TaxID=259542 RepID=A0AAV4A6H8_9GAST|nr:hypothetical protein PoB_003028000 [Plakobranchus ocellatus]
MGKLAYAETGCATWPQVILPGFVQHVHKSGVVGSLPKLFCHVTDSTGLLHTAPVCKTHRGTKNTGTFNVDVIIHLSSMESIV